MLRWKLKMGAKKEAVSGGVGFNLHMRYFHQEHFTVLATKHFGYSKTPQKKLNAKSYKII